MSEHQRPWYRELNRYHWFVLTVCTLGWMFDCLDQQLFNANRRPAMEELLAVDPGDPLVDKWAGWSTSVLLFGWASGGIVFGIMGDRIGRARTMVFTILSYSMFTGLSAFSFTVYDFLLYRFLTGLGVGGQFAVGVALVAEALPDRARPPALGMLQALSAVGNVSAAFIVLLFEYLTSTGALPYSGWRWIFGVGVFPAVLAVVVISRLKEPERWQKAVAEGEKAKKAGSITELFGDPRWRRNTIGGMILAASGVIGLWGIGVFSYDLTHSVFLSKAEARARGEGKAELDRQFVALAVEAPEEFAALPEAEKPSPSALLGMEAGAMDPRYLYAAIQTLQEQGKAVTVDAVLDVLDERSGEGATPLDRLAPNREAQSAEERARRREYLQTGIAEIPQGEPGKLLAENAERINKRFKEISGRVGHWRGIGLMFFNIGAFFGIYSFSLVTQRIGRRPTFAIFFLLAIFSTSAAFLLLREPWHVYVLVPLMGFFQLSVFGGYAIYFPELFPTHLRSTGTSFCYNIARFVAVPGPTVLGLLSSQVFGSYAEPMRYAGVTMCVFYLVGIFVLPFIPETKDQPLPE